MLSIPSCHILSQQNKKKLVPAQKMQNEESIFTQDLTNSQHEEPSLLIQELSQTVSSIKDSKEEQVDDLAATCELAFYHLGLLERQLKSANAMYKQVQFGVTTTLTQQLFTKKQYSLQDARKLLSQLQTLTNEHFQQHQKVMLESSDLQERVNQAETNQVIFQNKFATIQQKLESTQHQYKDTVRAMQQMLQREAQAVGKDVEETDHDNDHDTMVQDILDASGKMMQIQQAQIFAYSFEQWVQASIW